MFEVISCYFILDSYFARPFRSLGCPPRRSRYDAAGALWLLRRRGDQRISQGNRWKLHGPMVAGQCSYLSDIESVEACLKACHVCHFLVHFWSTKAWIKRFCFSNSIAAYTFLYASRVTFAVDFEYIVMYYILFLEIWETSVCLWSLWDGNKSLAIPSCLVQNPTPTIVCFLMHLHCNDKSSFLLRRTLF